MTKQEALALGRPLGGLAVKGKAPPEKCPRCGKSMIGRSWLSYLGHLVQRNGLRAQDPAPWNGAWGG